MPSNSQPKILASGLGRRKEAVVSVRLTSGSGKIVVNGQTADSYFPGISAKVRLQKPFVAIDSSKYDVSVKAAGGGKSAQVDAVSLGIARALSTLKDTHKSLLRTAGLLTRDSRARQRRMVGMGGKSRRRKQSPKR